MSEAAAVKVMLLLALPCQDGGIEGKPCQHEMNVTMMSCQHVTKVTTMTRAYRRQGDSLLGCAKCAGDTDSPGDWAGCPRVN
jgi:hypothetical protein